MNREFLLCSHPGCNRKYKSEKKWVAHLVGVHNVVDPVLPEPTHVEKHKSGCATNRKLAHDQQLDAARKRRDIQRAAEQEADKRLKTRFGEDYEQREAVQLEIQQRVRSNPGDCAICMEEFTDGACVPCGHAYFHYRCVLQWVNTKHTCPFCRKEVSSVLKLYQ